MISSMFKLLWLLICISMTLCQKNMQETKFPDDLDPATLNNLRIIHSSLSVQTYNPGKAKLNIMALMDKSHLNIPFLNEIPLLHQMLNLYFQSARAPPQQYKEIRSSLAELMLLVMKYNIDVDMGYKKDPSAFFKAMMMREIDLATAIASNSKLITKVVDASFEDVSGVIETLLNDVSTDFKQLYAVPCEAVPLTKLVLHADTLVRDKMATEEEVPLSWIENLLLSANPGPGSKPSAKVQDLFKYSRTFNESIVKQLGINSKYRGVKLAHIITALDESIAQAHRYMLNQYVHIPKSRDARNFEDIRIGNEKAKLLGSVIVYQDNIYSRNILHHLTMSGATISMTSLYYLLEKLLSREVANNKYHEDEEEVDKRLKAVNVVRDALQKALLGSPDVRNFLPYHYAALRYGYNSSIFEITQRLYSLINYDIDKAAIAKMFPATMDVYLNKMQSNTCDVTDGECVPKKVKAKSSDELSARDVGGWDDHRITITEEDIKKAKSNQINDIDIVNDVDRCDIEERWEGNLPSPTEFYETYVKTSTPIIFRGVNDVNTPLRMAFEKKRFLKRYGTEKAPVSKIPYAGSFGIPSSETRLESVANITIHDIALQKLSYPKYAFTVASSNWKSKLQEDIPLPYCLERMEVKGTILSDKDGTVETQFYLGPATSGKQQTHYTCSPVHFHGHAVNSLAYGEKKWFLYPPSEAFYTSVPALDFVLHDPVAKQAVTCTQRAGDVMFVPAFWAHGTLNTKQTIGVAHEFSIEPFCSE